MKKIIIGTTILGVFTAIASIGLTTQAAPNPLQKDLAYYDMTDTSLTSEVTAHDATNLVITNYSANNGTLTRKNTGGVGNSAYIDGMKRNTSPSADSTYYVDFTVDTTNAQNLAYSFTPCYDNSSSGSNVANIKIQANTGSGFEDITDASTVLVSTAGGCASPITLPIDSVYNNQSSVDFRLVASVLSASSRRVGLDDIKITGEIPYDIVSVDSLDDITITAGDSPILPDVVGVTYNDPLDTTDMAAVVWDESDVDYNSAGVYTLQGTVDGTTITATINIIVESKPEIDDPVIITPEEPVVNNPVITAPNTGYRIIK